MLRQPSRWTIRCVCAVMFLGTVAPLLAKDEPPPNPNANLFKGYSVAFIPFTMDTGKEATRDKVEPALKSTFEAFGFTTMMGAPVLDAIKTALGETVVAAGSNGLGLLPDASAAKVGEVLGVNYVVCGDLVVKSRRIWQITGPRAKAIANLKTSIVAATAARNVYATQAEADNQANVTGQIATIVLLGWIFTPFLSGSRSAQESKALQNCVIKAYDPFFIQLKNAIAGQNTTQ